MNEFEKRYGKEPVETEGSFEEEMKTSHLRLIWIVRQDAWQESAKRIKAKAIRILEGLRKDPGYYCGNKCLRELKKKL